MSHHSHTHIRSVRAIGIPVRDQDRAIAFYVDTLGLETRRDVDVPQFGGRWIEVAPPGQQDVTLALVPQREGVPAGVETGIRLATDDAAAAHAALSEAGVEVGELLRWPGVPPMFAIRDPDGNGLEMSEAG
jgi:lactoylglutathione lyase